MNKQEKVVCQGVNFIIRDFNECHEDQDNGFTYHVPFILSADEMSVSCARSAIIDDIESGENWEIVREDIGFITSKNRFVGAKEAKKISVYNDNRVDYGIYKEMERLRKEIAKANNKRNRGDLSVELSLNILMNKYSELESKLNEFRSRDYLLPEDLY